MLAAPVGRFITLEGMDGAGKTTHLNGLAAYLKAQKLSVLVTREPGGTPLGEALRTLILHQPMCVETEALLLFAARRQHVREVIGPALQRGEWVLCDRFIDSSYAYQGGGRGLSTARLEAIEHWMGYTLRPDLTLVFDLPPEISRARVLNARYPDRFEQQDLAFFSRVRAAYLSRISQEPERLRRIDAQQPIAEIHRQLTYWIDCWIKDHACE